MPSCFVPGCRSGYRTTNEVRKFFRPPANKDIFLKWKKAIRRKDRQLTEKSFICDLHFSEELIVKADRFIINNEVVEIRRQNCYLKPNSVPSIFPKLSKYLTTRPKPRRSPRLRKNSCKTARRNTIPKRSRSSGNGGITSNIHNNEKVPDSLGLTEQKVYPEDHIPVPVSNIKQKLNLEMIKEEPHSDLEDSHEGMLFNACNIGLNEEGSMQDIYSVSVKSENQQSVDGMLEEEPHSNIDSYSVPFLGPSDIKKEDSYVQDVKIEEQLSLEMIKEEPHSDLEDSHEGTLLNMCNIKKEDGNNQDICFVSVKSENQQNADMFEEEPNSNSGNYSVSHLGVTDIKKDDLDVQDTVTGVKVEEQPSIEELKVGPDLDSYASSSLAFCDIEKKECVIQDMSMETIEEEKHKLISNTGTESDKNLFMEKTNLSGQDDSEYLFICDVCKKPFNSNRNFKIHQYFHTNEPFVCDVCNKPFKYKGNLKTHQLQKSHFVGELRKRGDERGGEFVCICKKTFTQKRYLKKHLHNKKHFYTQPSPFASDQ